MTTTKTNLVMNGKPVELRSKACGPKRIFVAAIVDGMTVKTADFANGTPASEIEAEFKALLEIE